ncbi:MAG: hypothetical protein QW260_08410 [Thermoproteota archaeon]
MGVIIRKIEVSEDNVVTFSVELPPEGFTKEGLAQAFVEDLSDAVENNPSLLLGHNVRFSGRMTLEIAAVAAAAAVRLGATGVEFSTPDGKFLPILGPRGFISLPTTITPGMIVEIVSDGGLFRQGARAVVLNVGKRNVNIAEIGSGRSSYGSRRDTGWTDITNVRPVGWENPPSLV